MGRAGGRVVRVIYTADLGSSPGRWTPLHVTPPSLSCSFLSLYCHIKASMLENKNNKNKLVK